MSDLSPEDSPQQAPVNFPHYPHPPQGIPVAHPDHAKVLMKRIRALEVSKPKGKRKGLTTNDKVRIKKRRPVFW